MAEFYDELRKIQVRIRNERILLQDIRSFALYTKKLGHKLSADEKAQAQNIIKRGLNKIKDLAEDKSWGVFLRANHKFLGTNKAILSPQEREAIAELNAIIEPLFIDEFNKKINSDGEVLNADLIIYINILNKQESTRDNAQVQKAKDILIQRASLIKSEDLEPKYEKLLVKIVALLVNPFDEIKLAQLMQAKYGRFAIEKFVQQVKHPEIRELLSEFIFKADFDSKDSDITKRNKALEVFLKRTEMLEEVLESKASDFDIRKQRNALLIDCAKKVLPQGEQKDQDQLEPISDDQRLFLKNALIPLLATTDSVIQFLQETGDHGTAALCALSLDQPTVAKKDYMSRVLEEVLHSAGLRINDDTRHQLNVTGLLLLVEKNIAILDKVPANQPILEQDKQTFVGSLVDLTGNVNMPVVKGIRLSDQTTLESRVNEAILYGNTYNNEFSLESARELADTIRTLQDPSHVERIASARVEGSAEYFELPLTSRMLARQPSSPDRKKYRKHVVADLTRQKSNLIKTIQNTIGLSLTELKLEDAEKKATAARNLDKIFRIIGKENAHLLCVPEHEKPEPDRMTHARVFTANHLLHHHFDAVINRLTFIVNTIAIKEPETVIQFFNGYLSKQSPHSKILAKAILTSPRMVRGLYNTVPSPHPDLDKIIETLDINSAIEVFDHASQLTNKIIDKKHAINLQMKLLSIPRFRDALINSREHSPKKAVSAFSHWSRLDFFNQIDATQDPAVKAFLKLIRLGNPEAVHQLIKKGVLDRYLDELDLSTLDPGYIKLFDPSCRIVLLAKKWNENLNPPMREALIGNPNELVRIINQKDMRHAQAARILLAEANKREVISKEQLIEETKNDTENKRNTETAIHNLVLAGICNLDSSYDVKLDPNRYGDNPLIVDDIKTFLTKCIRLPSGIFNNAALLGGVMGGMISVPGQAVDMAVQNVSFIEKANLNAFKFILYRPEIVLALTTEDYKKVIEKAVTKGFSPRDFLELVKFYEEKSLNNGAALGVLEELLSTPNFLAFYKANTHFERPDALALIELVDLYSQYTTSKMTRNNKITNETIESLEKAHQGKATQDANLKVVGAITFKQNGEKLKTLLKVSENHKPPSYLPAFLAIIAGLALMAGAVTGIAHIVATAPVGASVGAIAIHVVVVSSAAAWQAAVVVGTGLAHFAMVAIPSLSLLAAAGAVLVIALGAAAILLALKVAYNKAKDLWHGRTALDTNGKHKIQGALEYLNENEFIFPCKGKEKEIGRTLSHGKANGWDLQIPKDKKEFCARVESKYVIDAHKQKNWSIFSFFDKAIAILRSIKGCWGTDEYLANAVATAAVGREQELAEPVVAAEQPQAYTVQRHLPKPGELPRSAPIKVPQAGRASSAHPNISESPSLLPEDFVSAWKHDRNPSPGLFSGEPSPKNEEKEQEAGLGKSVSEAATNVVKEHNGSHAPKYPQGFYKSLDPLTRNQVDRIKDPVKQQKMLEQLYERIKKVGR